MIKLIIGFVLGALVTVEAGMIVYCIRYEHKHPEAIAPYRKNEFHRETHY